MNIIIIGATSGIGRALFERYAADGNRIGIVGRRTHLLDELRQEHPDTTATATRWTIPWSVLPPTPTSLAGLLSSMRSITSSSSKATATSSPSPRPCRYSNAQRRRSVLGDACREGSQSDRRSYSQAEVQSIRHQAMAFPRHHQ